MISGFKYWDVNGNGLWDQGESPLSNWTIKLSDSQTTQTTATDQNGRFQFSNLSEGDYRVEEVQQQGWIQTNPDNPGYYDVTVNQNGIQWSGTIDGVNGLDYIKTLICGGSATVVVDVYGVSPGQYYLNNTAVLKTVSGVLIRESPFTGPMITVVGDSGAPDNLNFGNYALGTVNGLTPGYWKNWKNHYTSEQFARLLAGTFVGSSIHEANRVFAEYNTRKGMELTMLKAHLLAAQLTYGLVVNPQMPNPDKGFMTPTYQIQYKGQSVSVGEVVNQAVAINSSPSAYTRDQIIAVKNMLDIINNL